MTTTHLTLLGLRMRNALSHSWSIDYMDLVQHYLRDLQALHSDRFLVETHLKKDMPEESDFLKFEHRLGLDPLPREPAHTNAIYAKTDVKEAGIAPVGANIWQQASSLLPKRFFVGEEFLLRIQREEEDLTIDKPAVVLQSLRKYVNTLASNRDTISNLIQDSRRFHPRIQKEIQDELKIRYSLIYALSRHIIGYLPRTISYIDDVKYLDPFASAVFALLILSRRTSMKLNWITALHQPRNLAMSLTSIAPVIPRLEGALICPRKTSYREVLQRLAASTCVLTEELIAVNMEMANRGYQSNLSGQLVKEVLGDTERIARYKSRIFERGTHEHFIANLPRMTWKYRYLLLKEKPRRLLADSLVERRRLMDSSLNTVDTYIEPKDGEQVSYPKYVVHDFSVETESISMRLDLFNPQTREWKIEPWNDDYLEKKEKPSDWLRLDCTQKGETIRLTASAMELLMLLLTNQGGPQDRYEIFRMMRYSFPTARQYIRKLLDQSAASVLYHPYPEFSALTDEILLVVIGDKSSRIDQILSWLTSTLPYVHARRSSGGKSIVLHLKIPMHSIGIIKGIIENELNDCDVTIATVSKTDRFYLSAFEKAYDQEASEWMNSWK